MFAFCKIWHALFFCNTHVEFHPFPLLPTINVTTIFNIFLISNLLVFWKLGIGALLFQYTLYTTKIIDFLNFLECKAIVT